MTYRELYEFGCLELKAADILEFDIDARLLIEYVCKTSYSDMFVKGDMQIDEEKESLYKRLVAARAEHIPVQHLTHSQMFMGLDFFVTSDVLVPRQDTETLVEEVMKDLHDGMRILDMCTGSGCILLSLLKYSNDTTGVGVDVSNPALMVAEENADRLELSDRVDFLESDLFADVEGTFDILVSNPPYIKTKEIDGLMPEVKEHDPWLALDGHEDGLFFYRRIIEKADKHLARGALVAFEIGCDQGKEVSDLMTEHGYADVEVINDLAGNPRVVKGFYRGNKEAKNV